MFKHKLKYFKINFVDTRQNTHLKEWNFFFLFCRLDISFMENNLVRESSIAII